MTEQDLQRLAQKLRRPPAGLAPLGLLSDADFARLEALVGRSCEELETRSRRELEHALPWPLRALLWPRSER
ncbi:hypothetical protein D0B54_05595 [Solimonas sp. K1W22B-7]|uniref:hypothetical protein n=1 Tax=Solimonas sp. K1W22B-7 TaxID=2303331 RepID=UPI000E331D10|nr:hypothetical protein [Solimonas sp. K1W22B-7]AXQ28181.1 hypothetical protein D0B54_05595 [Solimonas sp. K1W22B-7]